MASCSNQDFFFLVNKSFSFLQPPRNEVRLHVTSTVDESRHLTMLNPWLELGPYTLKATVLAAIKELPLSPTKKKG